MVSWSPIWAVVLRHARMWRRDINLLLGGFYWPLLDIIIWGFLGSWIAQSHTAAFSNYETTALMGILLWQVVGRGCNIIVLSLGEEIWSSNLITLFSLPLHIAQWIMGVLIFYSIMMLLTFIFCTFCMLLLYNISLSTILPTFFIFMPPLLFSCIWLAFTGLAIIISFGKRGMELGFVIGWFLMPFSGAYYPIEVLPVWAQTLSKFLPMSYVFTGMRNMLMYHQSAAQLLLKGYLLGLLYAALAILFFAYCFKRTKQRGLARLSD